jgi:hypothetical protein
MALLLGANMAAMKELTAKVDALASVNRAGR